MKAQMIVCAVVWILLCASESYADENVYLNGTVTEVGDGDTIKINSGGDPAIIEVRFSGIDAPEKAWPGHWGKQPFSDQARDFVKAQINGKHVTVLLTGDQTYGRVVGEVFFQGRSINRELAKKGLAWWNKKYAPGDFDLRELQQAAEAAKLGLWNRNDMQYTTEFPFAPPWKWRHSGLGND